IDLDLSNINLKYKPKERKIPTDQEIVDSVRKIDEYINALTINKTRAILSANRTKLVYGLMAIYGLRPREIFNQPDLDWLTSPENKNSTFKVHESNKTGYREVFPFVPEWIEILDLQNTVNIRLLKEYCYYTEATTTLCARVSRLSWFFNKYKIPFAPYDLRHACAIRAHLQGIPIKAAADNLGHTVEMHTKVYQRWFGLENRKKAFEQTFREQNELQRVLDENAQLRKQVAELELEVTRLRLTNQIQ
ncbi:MAG: site-specific integrase, partial [Cyanobacteria bacterium P01_H01_bin.150]